MYIAGAYSTRALAEHHAEAFTDLYVDAVELDKPVATHPKGQRAWWSYIDEHGGISIYAAESNRCVPYPGHEVIEPEKGTVWLWAASQGEAETKVREILGHRGAWVRYSSERGPRLDDRVRLDGADDTGDVDRLAGPADQYNPEVPEGHVGILGCASTNKWVIADVSMLRYWVSKHVEAQVGDSEAESIVAAPIEMACPRMCCLHSGRPEQTPNGWPCKCKCHKVG